MKDRVGEIYRPSFSEEQMGPERRQKEEEYKKNSRQGKTNAKMELFFSLPPRLKSAFFGADALFSFYFP